MSATIDLGETVTTTDRETIERGLRDFNETFLGPRDFRPLGAFARIDGRLIGGLVGETSRRVLRIEYLWISPEHRGGGLGSRLLIAAEEEASRRGCATAFVETFDFQARPFYERFGYRVVGELDGFANGRKNFFLSKGI